MHGKRCELVGHVILQLDHASQLHTQTITKCNDVTLSTNMDYITAIQTFCIPFTSFSSLQITT